MSQEPRFLKEDRKPASEQEGQNVIEYALLSLLISLLAVISVRGLSAAVSASIAQIATNLNSAF
jgi:Flp pilus assembly pilin Flp